MNLTIITDKFWENGGSLTEIKIVFVNGKIRLLRKAGISLSRYIE